MFKQLKIAKGVKLALAFAFLFVLIGFAGQKQKGDRCRDIVVKLSNQYKNFFLDENDILLLMQADLVKPLAGSLFKDIDLKQLEQGVKSQPFIKEAEIYRDLKGNLLVNAELRRPFARILEPGKANGYVALDGTILPVSDKYTARAVILSGSYMPEMVKAPLTQTEQGQKIYALLKFIRNDPFWKAQIAQVDIDNQGYVRLYPQVTKQVVEFGELKDTEEKFKKLKVFYTKVLPQKGWNTYNRINLQYKDQIVAE